jgi:hypothetical protein
LRVAGHPQACNAKCKKSNGKKIAFHWQMHTYTDLPIATQKQEFERIFLFYYHALALLDCYNDCGGIWQQQRKRTPSENRFSLALLR